MIILVCGLLGTGKTLFLTYLANLEKEQTVYANFNLKIKNFIRVSPNDLENLKKGLLIVDEAYSWLESRTSGSTENRYLTNRIGFNSRKRKFTVVLSAQILSSIDVRFRKLAEFIVLAVGFSRKEDGYVYYISDKFSVTRFVLPLKMAERLYKLYDTFEVEEDSQPTTFEPERLNKYINEFVEIVLKDYGQKTYQLSKNMICDILLEQNKAIPSRRIVERVYARIKRLKLERE